MLCWGSNGRQWHVQWYKCIMSCFLKRPYETFVAPSSADITSSSGSVTSCDVIASSAWVVCVANDDIFGCAIPAATSAHARSTTAFRTFQDLHKNITSKSEVAYLFSDWRHGIRSEKLQRQKITQFRPTPKTETKLSVRAIYVPLLCWCAR